MNPRPQVVDLGPLAPLERSDRNRQVAGNIAGAAVTLFAGLLSFGSPLGPEWVHVAFLIAFLALAAWFVYQLMQALVRRPQALEVSGQGIRLVFANGLTQNLSWTEVASWVQIEEVTIQAPAPDIRMGSRFQLAKPIPHSFRAPNPGLKIIRTSATAAGLTEEVRTLTRPAASLWAPLGIKVRFRFTGVPATP